MSFIDWIILSSGWRRALVAFLAGASGALALAPFDIWPLMAVAMCVAVWLLDGAGQGRTADNSKAGLRRWLGGTGSFWTGWFWGFGYFTAGLWWLGAAFLVEADKFAALMPLGVIGLPAGLAFFPAFGFLIARLVWSPGALRIFALAFGLGLTEWLRGHILTGFPWNEPGMALGDNLVLAQAASLFGLYGLNFLAIVIFAAPAALILPGNRRFVAAVSGGGLLALALFGMVRLNLNPTQWVPDVHLRLMQPNVPLDDNFRPANKVAIVQRYLAMSGRTDKTHPDGIHGVTHLIWPESSFPTLLAQDPEILSMIGQFLPESTVLLTGAVRYDDTAADGRAHYMNSLEVVTSGGIITGSYDKVHLVPFGEYLPMEGLLRMLGLRQFVQMPGGFDAGTLNHLLDVPNMPPVAPAICYEAIFPGEVYGLGLRPGLILNVTNDGWFGRTPGPYQHFAQARLRAIEDGLPLIRDANSGISAVVDPVGRIMSRLPLETTDVLDSDLPRALPETIFVRFGPLMPAILFILTVILALWGHFRPAERPVQAL